MMFHVISHLQATMVTMVTMVTVTVTFIVVPLVAHLSADTGAVEY